MRAAFGRAVFDQIVDGNIKDFGEFFQGHDRASFAPILDIADLDTVDA